MEFFRTQVAPNTLAKLAAPSASRSVGSTMKVTSVPKTKGAETWTALLTEVRNPTARP